MADDPRMADVFDELDAIEAEMDAEARELRGEPKPKTWTTQQMLGELIKVGIDLTPAGLPSREWTEEQAFEELKKRGITL